MNYKEKYQKALERARKLYDSSEYVCEMDSYATIFPELRESEDEKIRKEIIQSIKDNMCVIHKEKCIAWLEKQGQGTQKSTIDIDKMVADYSDNPEKNNESFGRPVNCMIRAYKQGIYDLLEKQGEKSVCKVKIGETYKCIASPRYTCFRTDDIYYVTDNFVAELINTCSDCFVLLEKQGEQKSIGEIKPKFKYGDWITNGEYTWRITDTKPLDYILQSPNGNTVDDTISHVNEHFHLWTIQDAKEGDVIFSNDGHGSDSIELIKSIYDKCINFWFCLSSKNNFKDYHYEVYNGNIPYTNFASRKDATPATEEQRDLLFSKMKEAGYEWDVEKKELKKIEQKPTWSEEDEKMLNSIIEEIRPFGECPDYPTDEDREYYYGRTKMIDWLKSLKPQQNLYDKGYNDGYSAAKYNHWKPSEEQMKALETTIHISNFGLDIDRLRMLESLYNDLKKL